MATISPTTPARACAPTFTPTPISSHFSELLGALARHIEAERDIEGVDIWNGAFRGWLTEAEHCYDQVSTLIYAIRRAPLARPEDLPLQRMAALLDAMLGSEEPGSFQRIQRLLPGAMSLLRCPGDGVVAQRVQQMIHSAFLRIEELAMLQTYGGCDTTDAETASGPEALPAPSP